MATDEVVIIADSTSRGYGFAKKVYEYIINKEERDFPLRLVDLEIKEFRDKEKKVRIKDNVRERRCFFIHDSNKDPMTWFFELAAVNEALKYSDAQKIVDVLPDLRFSRQDRKDKSRVAVNSRLVADGVSMYAHRMMTVDIHALQIAGMYKIPVDPLYSFPTLVEYIYQNYRDFLTNLVIMSPDSGGATRAENFKNRLKDLGIETGLAIGYKNRPMPGEISRDKYAVLGEVSGKNILMLDDIIDSGNTLITAVNKSRELGAKKIWAYATHGLFTEGIDKVVCSFDKVLVSDTLSTVPHERLEVISMTGLVGEAIFRTVRGDSLSSLFEKLEVEKEQ